MELHEPQARGAGRVHEGTVPQGPHGLEIAGSGGEKYPEVQSERVWDDIVKKLMQKEYKFDAGDVRLDERVRQEDRVLLPREHPGGRGVPRGGRRAPDCSPSAGSPRGCSPTGSASPRASCSGACGSRTRSSTWTRRSRRRCGSSRRRRRPGSRPTRCSRRLRRPWTPGDLTPAEVLHVGSNLARDIAPAKKHGFRTALFAGDKRSLVATPEQLKDPACRPDVLLTELPQLLEVTG